MTEVKHVDNGTVELPKGKTVGGSWQVVKKLGEGGCGSVYLVKNIEDDTEAAMKAESNTAAGGCVLKLEVAILKKLAGKPHVAQFMFAARLMDFSYVIMTLLGESLNKLVKRVGRQITVSSQVRIAANILFCLKQVHDIGFIHRDLKPANMALGYKNNTEECRFFHVLDFGLARQYVVSNSNDAKLMMRRPRERSLFRGTTRYCSIRMHDRAEQGRVDDLWSMLYLLAELRGPLPWASQSDKRVVGEMKRLHTDEVVLQNSPVEFLEIAKHLRSLTYFHRPDYYKMYQLMLGVMQKGKFFWSDPFDWETPPPPKSTMSIIVQSPLKKSREVVEKIKSRESGEPPKSLSKENDRRSSMERTSREKGSREMSRERMSKETGSNGSSPMGSGSAERADEDIKKEFMKILPFDPDFFASDAIGF